LICLLGGTFDPVHLGHLLAAERVCDALELTEIRLVLSARPSHKETTGASLDDRWKMLELACRDHPRLVPDDREVRRQRPSYTVETLEELRNEFPDEALVWVLGSDAYALLPSWYEWERVLELANLVVLTRPGHPLTLDARMTELTEDHRVQSLEDCHEGGILLLQDGLMEVAAADVRRDIAQGRAVGHLLPEPVAHYIKRHGLYRPGASRIEQPAQNEQD
jgi:nicotinate-nucleotide adenylyltransferase